jgi:hypothetical protein
MRDPIKQLLKISLISLDKAVFRGGFDKDETIIIVGSPRSGTTWVMELLNQLPDYTTIFEPFNPTQFPQVEPINISQRHYEAEKTENESLRDYLINVFVGKISSQRPRYRMTVGNFVKRVSANKLIVKFVRANRLVPWVLFTFDDIRLVYLIRHPCATISSQIRTGYTGYDVNDLGPSLNEIINDAKKIGFDNTIIDKLKGINNETQKLAAVWAMDQIIPMKHNHSRMFKFSYEDLMINNEKVIMNLLTFLDKKERYEKIHKVIEKPSILSKGKSHKELKKISWRTELNSKQIEDIRNVLNGFDISFDDSKYTILDKTFPIEF